MYRIFIFFLLSATSLVAFSQQKVVHGRVLSSDQSLPIAGATVSLKEVGGVYVTDSSGQFRVEVPAAHAVLIFSHLGYQAQTVSLRQQQSELIVYLVPSESVLKGVVVTGYERLPKERATGSFASVSNEALNRKASSGIVERLEDEVAGLLFDKRYSNTPTLTLRGQSTIMSDGAPLIVVDNFPFEGDINTINPNDVLTVSVLKDAAAASIWGSRAGNGVIVITTKYGSLNQPLNIQLNANTTVTEKPDLSNNRNFMRSSDFIMVEKMLFDQGYYEWQENDPGQVLSPVVQTLIAQRDGIISGEETQKILLELSQLDVRQDFARYFYQTGVKQQYAASARGGGQQVGYNLSAGFDKDVASLVGNGGNRFTTWNNITFKPSKRWQIRSSVFYNTGAESQNNSGIGEVNSGGGKGLYPYARLVDKQGQPASIGRDFNDQFLRDSDSIGFPNWGYRPLEDLRNANNKIQTELTRINTEIEYNIHRSLSGKLIYEFLSQSVTARNLQSFKKYYVRDLVNRYAFIDAGGELRFPVPPGDILDQRTENLRAHSARSQLNFNREWNTVHSLNAIAGIEIRQAGARANAYRLYGYDDKVGTYAPVDFTTEFANRPWGKLTIPHNLSVSGTDDRNLSYYGNAAYAFNGKYIVSGSARKDESNLFGVKTNQKGIPLWSAGVAWLLHSEEFFAPDFWLSFLKLRSTYGASGNVNKSLTAYTTANHSVNLTTKIPQATILSPPNPNLRWEKVKMLNVGIDFQTRGNLLAGSFDFYKKQSVDLIGRSPIDPTTGFMLGVDNYFIGNNADLKGIGMDIDLRLTTSGKISWTSTFLLSYSKDEVTKFEYQSRPIDYLSFYPSPMVGRPRFGVYSYPWAGLDPETGDPQFYLDGEISKDYSAIMKQSAEYLVYNGPALPTHFGAWKNTFGHRGFALGFTVSYKLGHYFLRPSINYSALFENWQGNADFEDRWQKSGDEKQTHVPSMPSSSNYNRNYLYNHASVLAEKGDHIRLKDVSLSYLLQRSEHSRMPFASLKLYAYLNNPGIIWRANKYKIDPDYIFQTLPQPTSFSMGASFQF